MILAFVLWWLTAHTPAGRYLFAIGGNTEAARLSGVRVERYTALALILSAVIAAFAGVMFSSLNGPSLNFGGTLLLPAFAAAFLGSTPSHCRSSGLRPASGRASRRGSGAAGRAAPASRPGSTTRVSPCRPVRSPRRRSRSRRLRHLRSRTDAAR